MLTEEHRARAEDMEKRLLVEPGSRRAHGERGALGARRRRRPVDAAGVRRSSRRRRGRGHDRPDDRDAIIAAAEALEEESKPFAERRMDRGIRAALAGKRIDALAPDDSTPDALTRNGD